MMHDVKSSSASKENAFSKVFDFRALLHHHIAALPAFATEKPALTRAQGESMGGSPPGSVHPAKAPAERAAETVESLIAKLSIEAVKPEKLRVMGLLIVPRW
jgi:hypothetical protein